MKKQLFHFLGRITLHVFWELNYDFLPNYCYNAATNRFVKCRDISFAKQVHREKAPTMVHHYHWGSKALNIANNTVFSQYSGKYIFLTFPACFSIPIFFSNFDFNCSNLSSLRNLQEQVKNHSVTKNSSDLLLFEQIILVISIFFSNSWPSGSHFKKIS